MTEAQNRRRASQQVLLATLWLTLLVLMVKVWAGWAVHSLSLLAEAMHTLIEGFSTVLSLLTLASYRGSVREWGRELEGHDIPETIVALLLVALLGFSGCNLLVMSVHALAANFQPIASETVQMSWQLAQLVGVVITISFCLAAFARYEARVLENASLRFHANYILQDAWLTVLVLVGLVGVGQGYGWLDSLLALLILATTVANCWRMVNWQLPLLVKQTAIAPEALAQTIHQVEGITQCYKLRSYGVVGRLVFVEMHLVLHPECLDIARSIAERVEGAIRARYGPVQAVIYIDVPSVPLQN